MSVNGILLPTTTYESNVLFALRFMIDKEVVRAVEAAAPPTPANDTPSRWMCCGCAAVGCLCWAGLPSCPDFKR